MLTEAQKKLARRTEDETRAYGEKLLRRLLAQLVQEYQDQRHPDALILADAQTQDMIVEGALPSLIAILLHKRQKYLARLEREQSGPELTDEEAEQIVRHAVQEYLKSTGA